MQPSNLRDPRGTQKYMGMQTAKDYVRQAPVGQSLIVATMDLNFGFTLDELRAEDLPLPRSNDPHFSWGFYKQVKSWVFAAVHKQKARRNRAGEVSHG